MSTPYTVICHRCGKPTFVDLSRTISDQRCRSCRGFLQGVDVGGAEHHRPKEGRRKLVVRVSGAAGREPEWQDQAAPVIPLRQRWPRFFRWSVWTSLIVFLALMGVVVNSTLQKWSDQAKDVKPVARQEEPVKIATVATAEWINKAIFVARKALAAKTTGELLPLLYHPEVGDDVIRRYYATEETLPLGADLNENEYDVRAGYKENVAAFRFVDSHGRPRAFVVVEKPDGMRIDWPSLVGFGEMSLKDYLHSAPPGVVILRARARPGEYYNNSFSDPKRWLSIRLCDVTNDNVIHAYFDRQLPGAADVAAVFPVPPDGAERADIPVIVVLKHSKENVAADQTQLVALLCLTWYLEEGLKPLIDHARNLDAVRNALSGDTAPQPKPDKPASSDPAAPPERPQTPPP